MEELLTRLGVTVRDWEYLMEKHSAGGDGCSKHVTILLDERELADIRQAYDALKDLSGQ